MSRENPHSFDVPTGRQPPYPAGSTSGRARPVLSSLRGRWQALGRVWQNKETHALPARHLDALSAGSHEDIQAFDVRTEPQYPVPAGSITGHTRPLLTSLRGRWQALGRIWQNNEKPAPPARYLGTLHAGCVVDDVFDGDLAIDSISGDCNVNLESRRGSITIAHKIDQSAHVNLKAAIAVTIGEGIGDHSNVRIVAGGDVTIGQAISDNSRATITSTGGKIEIGVRVDSKSEVKLISGTTVRIGEDISQFSIAIITAQKDITIGGRIGQHTTADFISLQGTISINQMVEDSVIALLTAGQAVHIGDKISQHSDVTVLAKEDVTIGKKIEQHSATKITTLTGSINIREGLCGSASATLTAVNGSVNIGGSVEAGSTINWNARDFSCPQGDGTIRHVQ
jgi:hypothetical protein